MTWNYRIIADDYSFEGEVFYGLHEVFYEDDKIVAWTKGPVALGSDTLAGLGEVLEHVQEALSQPVLWVRGDELTTMEKDEAPL